MTETQPQALTLILVFLQAAMVLFITVIGYLARRVDQRLTDVESRLSHIKAIVSRIEARQNDVFVRLDHLEARIERHIERVSNS